MKRQPQIDVENNMLFLLFKRSIYKPQNKLHKFTTISELMPILHHEVIVVREDSEKFHIIFHALRHLETFVDVLKAKINEDELANFERWCRVNKVRVQQTTLETLKE